MVSAFVHLASNVVLTSSMYSVCRCQGQEGQGKQEGGEGCGRTRSCDVGRSIRLHDPPLLRLDHRRPQGR